MISEWPTISVIIPAYNEEAALPGCLLTIKAAVDYCHYPIEVIVVDNASTDRTWKIAKECGARLVCERRRGITFARQAGFEAAKGSIICGLDADTRVPEDWFFRVMKAFRHGIVAVSGPSYFYDIPKRQRVLASLLLNVNAYLAYLINGRQLYGCNFAVRRDVLVRAGGFNTSIEFYGEDVDLARRIGRIGKMRWSWDIEVLASGRRIMAEGLLKTVAVYGLNYLAVMLLKRPLTKTHKDIRCSS